MPSLWYLKGTWLSEGAKHPTSENQNPLKCLRLDTNKEVPQITRPFWSIRAWTFVNITQRLVPVHFQFGGSSKWIFLFSSPSVNTFFTEYSKYSYSFSGQHNCFVCGWYELHTVSGMNTNTPVCVINSVLSNAPKRQSCEWILLTTEWLLIIIIIY